MLALSHTKQRNGLSHPSLNQLMRIVLLGPQKLDNRSWEDVIDTFRDSCQRRIDL